MPTQVRQADFLVEGEVGGGEDFGLPLLGMAVLPTLFNTGHRDFGKDQSMLVNSAWQHLLYTRVVLQSWSWPEPAGAGRSREFLAGVSLKARLRLPLR